MKNYKLQDVYGITERPIKDCPTFVERNIHSKFKYSVESENNHIIVYGASKQGKSWMVETYCPNFVRVGCDVKHTRETLFKSILLELGIKVGVINESQQSSLSGKMEGSIETKIPLIPPIGKVTTTASATGETSTADTFTYTNIDLTNETEVTNTISQHINNKLIVIENFHYLKTEVQKSFAACLRNFLYHDIRVIIVGVWKETTKLVSYASDLSGHCSYFDIGNWSVPELTEIITKGDSALNVYTSADIRTLFIQSSGYNIGIFKTILNNFCKEYDVYQTVQSSIFTPPKALNDLGIAEKALNDSASELIAPVLERIHNLATSKKSKTKGMRYHIVKGILSLFAEEDDAYATAGIPLQDIVDKVNASSNNAFDPSNIKQELINLHLRSETGKGDKEMNVNLIPLFYFDALKQNGTLYIVESILFFAKRRNIDFKTLLGPIQNYI